MRRFALVALICATACSKDDKKDAMASADEAAASRVQAREVVGGFKALAQEKKAEAEALGVTPSPGATGLEGLGGLFGGDAAATAAEMPDVRLPPAAPKGGDCDAVADRLMTAVGAYMDAELGKLSADERTMAEAMMGQLTGEMRGQFAGMCTTGAWSQAQRDCVLTATTVAALQACDRLAPSGAAAAAAPTGKAAPPWKGGNACKDVGARMKELTFAQVGEIPAEMRAELDRTLDESMKQMVDACVQGKWNAEVRTCMVQTASIDTIGDCFSKMTF